jgi:histidyl-tRNA synthetase
MVQWAAALGHTIGSDRVVFDPSLVRGMGYYTGSIVELVHPGLGVSLGGGGRYDGMVGRLLGPTTPAFGFSLGFERLMEVLGDVAHEGNGRVGLIYGPDVSVDTVLEIKNALIADGRSVVLAKNQKNAKVLYQRLFDQGVGQVAIVTPDTAVVGQLAWRLLEP